MFDYAMLIRLIESHVSNKSDKILYIFDDNRSLKHYKKRHKRPENVYYLTINDIWKGNCSNYRYKEYKFMNTIGL